MYPQPAQQQRNKQTENAWTYSHIILEIEGDEHNI
jgi:hypothetical protein